jgi:hypothetical protein
LRDALARATLSFVSQSTEFPMTQSDIDQILDKLVKDVEAAVHALYRGEVRQETVKSRTGHLAQDARDALVAVLSGIPAAAPAAPAAPAGAAGPVAVSPRPSVAAPMLAGAAYGWTKDDSDAVLKCIMSWLPLGVPASSAPDTKCIAAGKMLLPTWAERERAREAVRRITSA